MGLGLRGACEVGIPASRLLEHSLHPRHATGRALACSGRAACTRYWLSAPAAALPTPPAGRAATHGALCQQQLRARGIRWVQSRGWGWGRGTTACRLGGSSTAPAKRAQRSGGSACGRPLGTASVPRRMTRARGAPTLPCSAAVEPPARPAAAGHAAQAPAGGAAAHVAAATPVGLQTACLQASCDVPTACMRQPSAGPRRPTLMRARCSWSAPTAAGQAGKPALCTCSSCHAGSCVLCPPAQNIGTAPGGPSGSCTLQTWHPHVEGRRWSAFEAGASSVTVLAWRIVP